MEGQSSTSGSGQTKQDIPKEKTQPWLSFWPSTTRPDSAPGQINYAYSKGTPMVVAGSAGEWNWSIMYDTAESNGQQ
jgi:hypothetical protein